MGSVEFAVSHLGAGRVLFGSDAFIRNFAAMLAKVAAAKISTADKRRIVWDNSDALFFGGSAI
jgi:predicted TIM-barrel fold metal-dependent hydrolase